MVGRAAPEVMASISTRLPILSAVRVTGLAELLAEPPYNGHANMLPLAGRLLLQASDLLRLADVAAMLGFVDVRDGELHLSASGRALAETDMQGRKRLFAEHLLRSVPLAAHIRRILDERPGHTAPRSRFLAELEDHLSTEEAEHTLSAVIGWGRYAEVFAYDHPQRLFSVENPQ